MGPERTRIVDKARLRFWWLFRVELHALGRLWITTSVIEETITGGHLTYPKKCSSRESDTSLLLQLTS